MANPCRESGRSLAAYSSGTCASNSRSRTRLPSLSVGLAACACAASVLHAGLVLDDDFHPALTTTRDVLLFAVAIQSDGKVLVAGDFALINGVPHPGIARLHSDGSLDAAFDAGVGADGLVYSLAVEPGDGKVLAGGQFATVAGAPRTSLAKLNADGSLDPDFHPVIEGEGGAVVSTVLVQPDGQILIGGNFSVVCGLPRRGIARLLPTGALDRSFDPGLGLNEGTAHDLALQPDGRILVGGTFTEVGGLPRWGLARLRSDGRVDAEFNSSVFLGQGPGRVYAVSVHPDYGIVVGGAFDRVSSTARAGLARVRFDGSVDSGFDPQGGVIGGAAAPFDLLALPGGEVLVTGDFWYAAGAERTGLARLTPTGFADATFNPGPGLVAEGEAFGNMLAVQPDGKILVAGQFEEAGGVRRHCIARFLDDGTLDPTFSSTNAVLEFAGSVEAIAARPNGDLLIGGDFERVNGEWRQGLAELDRSGRLEKAFDAELSPGAVVHAIAVQPDDRVVIGGWFESASGFPRANFARLDPDGSLDGWFPEEGTDGPVHAIALQPDGGMFVAGEFRLFGNLRRFGLVRLDADGVPDEGFDARFEVGLDQSAVLALSLQPDGRLIAGGYFDSVNGEACAALARILPDGRLDQSFARSSIAGSPPVVHTLALRADARLLVGGTFETIEGESRQGMARLYEDGTLDASFDPGAGIFGDEQAAVNCLVLLPQGGIVVGGDFSRYHGQPAPYLALLTHQGSLPVNAALAGGPGAPVSAVVLQDDAILAGGSFSTVAGQVRLGLARFRATTDPEEPHVAITAKDGQIKVHWDSDGYLAEAAEVTGDWQEVENATSPYTPPETAGARFYRLEH